MPRTKKTNTKVEFGDFQTPYSLACEVCHLLHRLGVSPTSILEPTCGTGNFLIAACQYFYDAVRVLGVEIKESRARTAQAALSRTGFFDRAQVLQGDFFQVDWNDILRSLPDPLLLVGNPPWVTNSELGSMGGTNLPRKQNTQGLSGIQARTGKSNFDISEWMLLHLLDLVNERDATLAMLCKTAVARKVLFYGWKHGKHIASSHIFPIDAPKHFGASVDACLLVIRVSTAGRHFDCVVHQGLEEGAAAGEFGYRNGELIADVLAYERWKHLQGPERYKWRSGIKHDCAALMELRKEGDLYRNGMGELVEIEEDCLYPMLKGSQIVKGGEMKPSKWMLVTQHFVGEDTGGIAIQFPKTWEYLTRHSARLDRRASSIYTRQPRFSMFGVGDYAFSPWKVGVSALHKRAEFTMIGPHAGKPVVLDDTCNFVPCRTRDEAKLVTNLLSSDVAKQFLSAFVFWDAKRPLSIEVLRKLDLLELARELERENDLLGYLGPMQISVFA